MAKSRYADATKAARRAAMSAHKVTAAANAGSTDASAQPSASAVAEPARDARRDELTHVDAKGEVRMVDVSDKAETHRIAIAEGTILMHPETQAMVLQDRAKKGDVLACARVAGIMAIGGDAGRGRARGLGAGARGRAGRLSRTGYGGRDGQDGYRDGGADRRERRVPNDLRHVQGRRSRHGDRRRASAAQGRRPLGY